MIRPRKHFYRITLFITLSLIIGCTPLDYGPRDRIIDITGYTIPTNSKIVYHHLSEVFVGRGFQYTVFYFKEPPTIFLLNFTKKIERFEKEYSEYLEAVKNARHSKLKIPDNYDIDFGLEYSYLWGEVTGYYFVYQNVSQIIVVVIKGT